MVGLTDGIEFDDQVYETAFDYGLASHLGPSSIPVFSARHGQFAVGDKVIFMDWPGTVVEMRGDQIAVISYDSNSESRHAVSVADLAHVERKASVRIRAPGEANTGMKFEGAKC